MGARNSQFARANNGTARITWPLIAILSLFILAGNASRPGARYQVLYRFLGGSDGYNPDAPLITDSLGNLYGTTNEGGQRSNNCSQGCGTVFELKPPTRGGAWKKVILHNFALTDGAAPGASPLVLDQAGNLFGTTNAGGRSNNSGVVFELSPPTKKGGQWKEAVVYAFTGGDDGGGPVGVIFDRLGNLYGTTLNGGKYGQQGAGTIFKLTQSGGSWSETTLYSFLLVKDGNRPSRLVFDRKGNLYGTTSGDDVSCGPKDPVNCGWAFELEAPAGRDAAWAYNQIHSFKGYNDGSFPSGGLIFDATGNLYGTTVGTGGTGNIADENAEGTVFRLAPPAKVGDPWKETLLHSFPRPGGIDGSGPFGGVTEDKSGNLYGTTFYGAGTGCVYRGCGSVFQLQPPATKGKVWKETQLHVFSSGSDGSNPGAPLTPGKGGIMFGVTPFGGGSGCEGSGCGTVFEVSP